MESAGDTLARRSPKWAVIERVPVLASCHGFHTHTPVDTCFHCDRHFAQFQINGVGRGDRQLRSSVEVVSDAKRVARFAVGEGWENTIALGLEDDKCKVNITFRKADATVRPVSGAARRGYVAARMPWGPVRELPRA